MSDVRFVVIETTLEICTKLNHYASVLRLSVNSSLDTMNSTKDTSSRLSSQAQEVTLVSAVVI